MKEMTDVEFYKGVARVCEDLLNNIARSFSVDIAGLNETMIELEKRANKSGMKRHDLYPDEVNPAK